MSSEQKRKLQATDEQQSSPSKKPKLEPQQPPHEVSDSVGDNLCPPLRQLLLAHRPQSAFDCMLLILHCLMVESGFIAVEADKAQMEGPEAPVSHYQLPSSVIKQLQVSNQHPAAVSIVYAYRRLIEGGRMPSRALLTVLNSGDAAVCSCAVFVADPTSATVCAFESFSIERHVLMEPVDRPGVARLSELQDLAVTFKDCISLRAKAAVHEACGQLPPAGLLEMPSELLLRVLWACEPADLGRLCQVSRRLSGVCSGNCVWRALLWSRFGDHGVFQQAREAELRGEDVSYREVFKLLSSLQAKEVDFICRPEKFGTCTVL